VQTVPGREAQKKALGRMVRNSHSRNGDAIDDKTTIKRAPFESGGTWGDSLGGRERLKEKYKRKSVPKGKGTMMVLKNGQQGGQL